MANPQITAHSSQPLPRRRVVVTGMGLVCPLGHDIETVWEAVLSGRSGVDANTIFDASTYPTHFDSEVKGYDVADHVRHPELHEKGNRGCRFAVGAAAKACRQAEIETERDPDQAAQDGVDRRRLGVYLGSGEGSVDNDMFFEALRQGWQPQGSTVDWIKWAQVAFSRTRPWHQLEQEPHMPLAHLAMLTGARGPMRSCLTACAASTQAVGEAMMLIRHGHADVMITGGCHSMIHPLGVMGFSRLTALSTNNASPKTASRPFSASRDGFVIGEGAAILILESLDSATRRKAKILAEVVGYGCSADAFRVTDMHEEARGPIQAMRAAIKDAGLSPEDIDYVNAHGTSTQENDSIETLAIRTVFADRGARPPVSSIKSTMGHLIGAAGAAEIITCVLALRDQTIPPTANLHDQDPKLDLDYVALKPRKARLRNVMKESFGFGGQNNVVILRQFADGESAR
jgi:3-oxoacyl-[acyl-carrier-protein] synthase II